MTLFIQELKLGLTELCTKESIGKVKNAVMGNSNGPTARSIWENSMIIKSTAKAHISGAIKESSRETGKQIKWTVKEYSTGQTEENTQDSIKMTKKKDMEFSNGIFNLLKSINHSTNK